MHYALVIGEEAKAISPLPKEDSILGAYIEVPDEVQCGWERVGEVWQKSAAIISFEADEIDRNTKKTTVGGMVNTLHAWADDVDAAIAAWDGWPTAQRFAALKTLTNRFGAMSDRLADFIQALRVDKP